MLYDSISTEEYDALDRAVRIMTAPHGSSGALAKDMMLPMMVTLASNKPSTGGHGTKHWVAAIRAFGECLISIAKMLDRSTSR